MNKKELFRFLVSGCSAVATDMGVYYLLKNSLDPNIAKGISFISGTIVAFLLNKYWTFGVTEKSKTEVLKFAFLYGCTFTINILVNSIVLKVIPEPTIFAFLCATGTSTVLNFVGQKFWVFRTPNP